ncbi:IclR family transcriptional regulator [Methylobacterium organophilum]|uniref:IclR family transcriptional regulator n=1 Tax=Methylobacterium organophilum TaxID=410 RepID=UPI001F1334AC|nr:IclR family transcriptional regulator [Methylobacterium organophilum]UMY17211.1 IclR family transcriptional regulator [Methylobacterium organophilum]
MTAQSKQRGRKAAADQAASEAPAPKGALPSAIDPGSLRGMDRSFAVLELLAQAPARVVDVTRALDLPWATVHRTIVQLEKAQFLRRDPETSRYQIGPRLWHIGSAYLSNHRVLTAAMPYLAKLSELDGIALQVVERIGWQSVVIYSHQHVDEDITKAHYGYHFPLHCASKGHVLLANEPPAFIDAYLARPLERLTPETVTDPVAVRAILEEVRASDFALTVGDVQLFAASMAAPIRDATGQTVAALCFVFRKNLLKSDARRETLREQIGHAAHSISLDLGWRHGR